MTDDNPDTNTGKSSHKASKRLTDIARRAVTAEVARALSVAGAAVHAQVTALILVTVRTFGEGRGTPASVSEECV